MNELYNPDPYYNEKHNAMVNQFSPFLAEFCLPQIPPSPPPNWIISTLDSANICGYQLSKRDLGGSRTGYLNDPVECVGQSLREIWGAVGQAF